MCDVAGIDVVFTTMWILLFSEWFLWLLWMLLMLLSDKFDGRNKFKACFLT